MTVKVLPIESGNVFNSELGTEMTAVVALVLELEKLTSAAERIAAELEWMRRQREPQPSRPPAKARPGAPVLFHKGGGGIVITHEFLTDHWEYLIRAYGEDTAHTFLEDEFELDGLPF